MDVVIAGRSFQVAQTPEQLAHAASRSWKLDPHLPEDNTAAFRQLWHRADGLVFEGRGGVLLEAMGDGVTRLVVNLNDGVDDQAVCIAAAMAYAFIATDCTRIITHCVGEELMEAAGIFTLRPYSSREVALGNGEKRTRFDLATALDEWLYLFGPRLFYVEATRLGNEAKAVRTLRRWSEYHRDPSVLQPDGEDGADALTSLITVARGIAQHQGFVWTDTTTEWVEHADGCEWEVNSCTCRPIVAFSDGNDVVRVDTAGNFQRAVLN